MTSWLGGRLIWTCFELRLQQNLHESTICQQRTSKNKSMNFASQRPLLAKVVHVIGIPPRPYIVHRLQALCTTCSNYLLVCERVLHWSLVKNIMNMELLTAINGQSQRAEIWSEWTLDDCVRCVCAVHTAWTYHQWATVYCEDTRHHVVCASCFQLIVRVFWNERHQFRSRSRQN